MRNEWSNVNVVGFVELQSAADCAMMISCHIHSVLRNTGLRDRVGVDGEMFLLRISEVRRRQSPVGAVQSVKKADEPVRDERIRVG